MLENLSHLSGIVKNNIEFYNNQIKTQKYEPKFKRSTINKTQYISSGLSQQTSKLQRSTSCEKLNKRKRDLSILTTKRDRPRLTPIIEENGDEIKPNETHIVKKPIIKHEPIKNTLKIKAVPLRSITNTIETLNRPKKINVAPRKSNSQHIIQACVKSPLVKKLVEKQTTSCDNMTKKSEALIELKDSLNFKKIKIFLRSPQKSNLAKETNNYQSDVEICFSNKISQENGLSNKKNSNEKLKSDFSKVKVENIDDEMKFYLNNIETKKVNNNKRKENQCSRKQDSFVWEIRSDFSRLNDRALNIDEELKLHFKVNYRA